MVPTELQFLFLLVICCAQHCLLFLSSLFRTDMKPPFLCLLHHQISAHQNSLYLVRALLSCSLLCLYRWQSVFSSQSASLREQN